ncbi:glutamine amidotransferase-related protein [Archaeoglobus profundus]|uniref:Glutamine amidotransferase domain-containing protein n=1 Tax=Archaeoglobus profundus (strain DSM 5631 / JCM 9629 / NBRC 100127 / Av18) TaxID=572546 RepID=D2RHG8_ARCPA|nr:hypothetical protein [Archaeoglobus profundus]ADB57743.1 hypothetical protein Arcpr_0679 [Archaeoglobus profundus DSM 5631]
MIAVISTCKYKLSEEEFVRPIVEIVRECKLNYRIVRYTEKIDVRDCSKVIICGTALRDYDYLNYIDSFEQLLDFEGCVLGICAGYHILATLFSNELEKVKKMGVYNVEVTRDNPLIEKGSMKSYFLHAYALRSINDSLECLAVQNDEVCMFRVEGIDFYGVSFYPEVLNREIVVNFLNFG